MLRRVKYTGPGGEVFPEFHWAPQTGEVREIDLPEDADLTGHSCLEDTEEPVTETEETEEDGEDE